MYSKGQFFSNTVYLERGMPYFAFMATNAVLVKKNRETFGRQKIKLPLHKGGFCADRYVCVVCFKFIYDFEL